MLIPCSQCPLSCHLLNKVLSLLILRDQALGLASLEVLPLCTCSNIHSSDLAYILRIKLHSVVKRMNIIIINKGCTHMWSNILKAKG